MDDIPAASPFQYAASLMEPGRVSPPIESGRRLYVLKVTYRGEFDGAAFAGQAAGIRDRLLQQKFQTYLSYWYADLRDNSDIEDYRGTF